MALDAVELREKSFQRKAELGEALLNDAGSEASYVGLLCVAASAFLFGLVAALVKFIAMNVYVMLQIRGTLQWVFSIGAVYYFLPGPATVDKFIGEPRHRPILFLRSGLYWVFISLFWNALVSMPVGDVTTVVYCAPIFTALFGWLLLGERVSPSVFACLALSMIGVSLITQPTFLFGQQGDEIEVSAQYERGMLHAFGSAVVGGLLPVLVRASKECHWTTVNHVTALCSSVVFTPAALVVMAFKDDASSEAGSEMWDGIQDPSALLMLVLVALVGFAGLGLQTYGYQREKAARASAMNFLEIPFAYVLQYVMFGDLITPLQGLGIFLVISCGLVNFWPRLMCNRCTQCNTDITTVETSDGELFDSETASTTPYTRGCENSLGEGIT